MDYKLLKIILASLPPFISPFFLSLILTLFFFSFRFLIRPPLGFRLSFLALPVSFISSLLFIKGSMAFPFQKPYQWIFIATLFGGLWPYFFISGESFRLKTFRNRFLVLGLFIFISFHSAFAIDLKSVGLLYILALILALAFWGFSEKLVPSRLFPQCSFLTALGLSFLFLFSENLKLAEMMGIFTVILGVATFWNLCFFFYPVGLNLIPSVVFIFITFLLSYGSLFNYPIQVFFIFSPFWLAWIFYRLKLKHWIQSLLLFFFSAPFSVYTLYPFYRTFSHILYE